MSLPYFPMFPKDFEAKTSHLTLEEDGAYNRLLRLMWMTPGCSLPDDDAWIMRRMRCDAETYNRVVMVVIDEFCERESGRVSNAKLSEVFAASSESHQKRVSAGSLGGKSKAMKTKETGPSNAKAMLKQPEPEPELVKREAKASHKKPPNGSRLPEQWTLPKEWGEWAISEGWADQVIRAEADKFRDYWHSVAGQKGRKADWQATWRNWMRNSKSPKFSAIDGGQHGQPSSKSETRLAAFIQGARGAS